MTEQDKKDLEWFIKNNQIRPRLLTNIFSITKEQLQEIINNCR